MPFLFSLVGIYLETFFLTTFRNIVIHLKFQSFSKTKWVLISFQNEHVILLNHPWVLHLNFKDMCGINPCHPIYCLVLRKCFLVYHILHHNLQCFFVYPIFLFIIIILPSQSKREMKLAKVMKWIEVWKRQKWIKVLFEWANVI